MTTAANAGVDSVGVDWGLRTVEELKANKATYIISNPVEILDIIEQ
jgi:phosphoglycolate phosphatase